MASKTKLETLFEKSDGDGILRLVLGEKRDDIEALSKAAWMLRDLMEYKGVIDVCDRILELQEYHVKTIELKALIMARMDERKRSEAMEMLEKVVIEFRENGEAGALMARLYKQMWRVSWYQGTGHPSEIQVAKNLKKARRELRYLRRSIEQYLDSFFKGDKKKDFYPVLNAVTLLAIERHLLPELDTDSQNREYKNNTDGLEDKVMTIINKEIADKKDDKDQMNRYWALISKVEMLLINDSSGEDEEHLKESTMAFLEKALSCLKHRLFHLDSTMQQFKMLLELGFRPERLTPVLNRMEKEWCEKLSDYETKLLQSHSAKTEPEIPVWLDDLFNLISNKVHDRDVRKRWKRYRKSQTVLRIFSDLAIKWEPIEQLTPKNAPPPTLGFELLGLSISNQSYGQVLAAAEKAGIKKKDLNMALLVLGLRTARLLQILMQTRKGRAALRLFYSFNFDYPMLNSPLLDVILNHYLPPSPASDDHLCFFFEVSEKFPFSEDDRDDDSDSKTMEKPDIDKACFKLKSTLNIYNLKLVLDDSNDMNPLVKSQLEEMTWKTKSDFKFTKGIIDKYIALPDARLRIVEELGALTVPEKEYVIEGIGDKTTYDLLQDAWPGKDYPPTGLQGWYIRIGNQWEEFFEPIRDESPDLPGGYRLQAWVEDRLGIY